MNGRQLIRRMARLGVLGTAGALAACATAPPAPEMSILDVIDDHEHLGQGPASCAALNAAAVCEKSTRLESGRNCQCADPASLRNTRSYRF
jgi:hypothetical protein